MSIFDEFRHGRDWLHFAAMHIITITATDSEPAAPTGSAESDRRATYR
jgi:hypothetical protein